MVRKKTTTEEKAKIIKKATKLRQKGTNLYQFKMTPVELAQIVYILRKSRNKPDALERKLIKSKVDSIKEAADEENVFFPNSIVINLDKTENLHVKPLAESINVDSANVPIIADDVTIEFNIRRLHGKIAEQDINKLLTDPTDKVGYITDGQHRQLGLLLSNQANNIELNVVAFVGAEDKVAYKTFADINEYQTKVTKTLLHHIRWEIEEFEEPSLEEAYELVLKLDKEDDSPLKGHIRIFEEDTGRWVSSPSITDWLSRYVMGVGKVLQNLSNKERLRILKNYFRAWEQLYPDQWNEDNRGEYVLTKAMGIRIMCTLFERAMRRCDRYEGERYDTKNFKRQLEGLKKIKIPLQPGQEVPLDWRGKVFGGLSSGKGINYIVGQILLQYPERGTI